MNVKGEVFLDQVPVTKEELASEMQALGRADPETVIMVRADEAISYGKLVEVMRILHDAKIARMALVTSPEK